MAITLARIPNYKILNDNLIKRFCHLQVFKNITMSYRKYANYLFK